MKQKSRIPKQPILALDPKALQDLQKVEAAQNGDVQAKKDLEKGDSVLDLILKSMDRLDKDNVERMAFEVDPGRNVTAYGGLYRLKTGLTPDHIIKKITGPQGDDLVCQILQARSNHIASFGRPRTSRFSVGFDFNAMNSLAHPKDGKEYQELQSKLIAAKELLWNCGYDIPKLSEDWHPNLSQFLKMVTRDGLAYGRFAVEFIYTQDMENAGVEKLHSFRAVDAGTIYRLMPFEETDQSIREEALRLLQDVKNRKFDVERYKKDEYVWVQVIEGKIRQAFTDKELIVYNLYPTSNVEYNGYPLTPIDQAIHAITMHINITMHNKLYFQNGRAARGVLVFKSDSIDESILQKVRLQYHQLINNVNNSWRMPTIGIGAEEEVDFVPIDTAGRDAEFQYLLDMNARVILSAFQMSPEELPGYSHLARGTNTQALSEGNNEWKLLAARDVGLRPLLYDIQDFFNAHVFPKFLLELSKTHQFEFVGLEKDSPEKEATRLSVDMGLHMTYDEVLQKVEKNPVGKELGGAIPLNPQFQEIMNAYFTVGQILENFMGVKGAASDPRYNYYRDPYFFQWSQILMQKAQLALQQQQMAMQMQQQQLSALQGGGQPQDGQPGQDGQNQQSDQEQDQGDGQGGEDNFGKFEPIPLPILAKASSSASKDELSEIKKANTQLIKDWQAASYDALAKASKTNHDMITKMLLRRQKEVTSNRLKEWKDRSAKMVKDIKKEFDRDEN